MNIHKYSAGVYGFFLIAGVIGLMLIPSQILVRGSAAAHHSAVRGDFFPRILLIGVVLISTLGFITEAVKGYKLESENHVSFGNIRYLIYAIIIIASYSFTFSILGFVGSTLICIPLLMKIFGVNKYLRIAVITGVFIMLIYLLFHFLLRMTLPPFILF